MMTRESIGKIGLWDTTQQGADFDLYLRTVKRSIIYEDMKPMHIALDCFNHHYIRLTANSVYPPFADKKNLVSLEEKWSSEDLKLLDRRFIS